MLNLQKQGDDGGPMNHYNNLTGTYTVAGVAWVGDATVNCQSSGLPTLYARVRNYVDWIYNNTDIAPTPKPTTTTTTTTTTTEDPTVFSCRFAPSPFFKWCLDQFLEQKKSKKKLKNLGISRMVSMPIRSTTVPPFSTCAPTISNQKW